MYRMYCHTDVRRAALLGIECGPCREPDVNQGLGEGPRNAFAAQHTARVFHSSWPALATIRQRCLPAFRAPQSLHVLGLERGEANDRSFFAVNRHCVVMLPSTVVGRAPLSPVVACSLAACSLDGAWANLHPRCFLPQKRSRLARRAIER